MSNSPLFDLYDPHGILEQQARAGLLPGGPRRPTISDLLPEDEKRGMLRTLASAGSSGLGTLGWLLDFPGSFVRGILAGKPLSFLGSSDERVDGRELLRQYGLVGKDNTWGSFGAGLAAEVLLDPTTYLSFGLSSLLGKGARTATGRAAQKAGLMTDFDLFARSQGMGVREAMRTKTPRDLLDYAVSSGRLDAQGVQEATERLRNFGGQLENTLGRTNRIGILGRDIGAFDLYGKTLGDKIARAADSIGEGAKTNAWTGPLVRGFAKRFNPDVLDTYGYDQQWKARELAAARRVALGKLRRDQALLVRNAEEALRKVGGSLDDPDLSDQIRYYMEGGGNAIDPKYSKFFDQPDFSALLTAMQGSRDAAIEEARRLGMSLDEYASYAGTDFFPRERLFFDSPRNAAWPAGVKQPAPRSPVARNSKRLFRTADTSGRRQPYLDVMGGARTVNLMSTDANLQKALRSADASQARALLDDWAARHNDGAALYQWIDDFNPETGEFAFTKVPPLPKEHPLSAQRSAIQKDLGDAVANMDNERVALLRKSLGEVDAQIPAAAREAYKHKLYGELADTLRNLDPQHASTGRGLFGTNAVQDWINYTNRRGTAATDAKQLWDLLSDPNNVTLENAANVPGGVNVTAREALSSLGLNGVGAENILTKRLGVDSLDDVSFSRRFVHDWKQAIGSNATGPEIPAALQAFDDYTNFWKTLTLLFPSRYTRDLYSGAYSAASMNAFNPVNWLAGLKLRSGNYGPLVDNWGPFKMFSPRLANVPGYEQLVRTDKRAAVEKFLADAAQQGLGRGTISDELGIGASRGQLKQLYPGRAAPTWESLLKRFYDPGRTASQAASDYMPWRLRNLAGNPNPILELGDRAAEGTDAMNRYGTYISMLRQGVAPEEAARVMNLTQVDYGRLTPFERNWMKRIFPFYSYTRGILPYIAHNIIESPSNVMGQTVRAVTRGTQPNEDSFVPDYLRKSSAIPLPESLGGKPRPGIQRFLTNIDLPFESTVNLFTPGVGATTGRQIADTINKTALNIFGQSNPLLKAPLELLTDRQLYSGRQMSDLYSFLEDAGVPGGRNLEQVLMNSPLNRIVGLTRQALDDRLTAKEKIPKLLINTLLGVKLRDIDEDRTRSFAARQILNELLQSTPGVRTYENLTVPEDALAKLSPDQQKQYLLYRVIQADAARRARERKLADSNDPLSILGVR